jgi:hypothetical protein
MVAKKIEKETEITVMEVQKGIIDFCVIGSTPIILNRVSEKAARELLLPRGRKKTDADKAASLKHDPLEEYRASPYKSNDPKSPTLLLVPSTSFKGALRSAALDIPGASKAQIGRLAYVPGSYISLYGVPQLFMAITRNSDPNRTPDVRTRAIVPQWACRVTMEFIKPMLREQTLSNLFAAAGLMRGIGDFRPEKGAGDYGQFRLVSKDDADFLRIIKTGGRVAQQKAMDEPQPYDEESADLLSWFEVESKRRGFKVAA